MQKVPDLQEMFAKHLHYLQECKRLATEGNALMAGCAAMDAEAAELKKAKKIEEARAVSSKADLQAKKAEKLLAKAQVMHYRAQLIEHLLTGRR
jgi:hypothetical protein